MSSMSCLTLFWWHPRPVLRRQGPCGRWASLDLGHNCQRTRAGTSSRDSLEGSLNLSKNINLYTNTDYFVYALHTFIDAREFAEKGWHSCRLGEKGHVKCLNEKLKKRLCADKSWNSFATWSNSSIWRPLQILFSLISIQQYSKKVLSSRSLRQHRPSQGDPW